VTRRSGGSRLVLEAALRAQRAGQLRGLVPVSARRLVKRRMAAWAGDAGADPLVDDWSSPLIAGRGGSPTMALESSAAAAASSGVPAGAVEPPRGAPRCLLVTSDLDVGGMDEMVAFLALRLRGHGIDTTVLHTCATEEATASPGRLARMLIDGGVPVVLHAEPAGRQWIRDFAPDVISAHGALGWALDEASTLGVPYVDVLHGMHSLFSTDWAAEERRNRKLARIIAVSEQVRLQYLSGAPSFPPERIVTIPNGVDDVRRVAVDRAAARAALGLKDEFLFVSLARHCLQKNTYALVAAFEEVAAAHPDAHLLIAGRVEDAMYGSQVRTLRDSLAARDRIHLRDHAPNPALLLAAADGFVLDSFFEGWALASMEALHAGLPVVASDVGGAREQLGEPGVRGRLVGNPLGDPLFMTWESMGAAQYAPQVNRGELVTAMSAVVRDRAHWAQQREALAAESAQRFHPDACLAAHAELLRSVVRVGQLNAA
jgi:glycosyltransferase involved in cell wall biosynthesis